MSNFFDLRCPKCHGEDSIDILASVWLRLMPDGTDADASACGDHEWCDQSAASCDACGYQGHVVDFESPGHTGQP
jgi:hypothetical protein